MEGGNYGFRGPLNKAWTEDRSTHWHQEVPGVAPLLLRLGAGSPCGLLIYEGTLLPPQYRGQLFHADAGKRIVAMYPLTVEGAGYTVRPSDVVNGGDDTWARPTDVATAPDGSVFIRRDPASAGIRWAIRKGRAAVSTGSRRPATRRGCLRSISHALEAAAAFGSPNPSAVPRAAIKAGQTAVPPGHVAPGDPILKARALWILGGLGDARSRDQESLRTPIPLPRAGLAGPPLRRQRVGAVAACCAIRRPRSTRDRADRIRRGCFRPISTRSRSSRRRNGSRR
jgi:hypothetical protein